ncbi:hypothetical protein ES703_114931 [subsurface metagenome]
METQEEKVKRRRNWSIIGSLFIIIIIYNIGRSLFLPQYVEVFEGRPLFGETRSFEVSANAEILQVSISWDGCDPKHRTKVELNIVLIGISGATESDLKRTDRNKGSTNLWEEGKVEYEIRHNSNYDSYYFRENSPFVRGMKINVVARIPSIIS